MISSKVTATKLQKTLNREIQSAALDTNNIKKTKVNIQKLLTLDTIIKDTIHFINVSTGDAPLCCNFYQFKQMGQVELAELACSPCDPSGAPAAMVQNMNVMLRIY